MKHTSGPWSYSMHGDSNFDMSNTPLTDFNSWVEDIEEKGQVELCKADFARTLERDRAELLEALQKLLDYANDSEDAQLGTLATGLVLDIARAAIAKATGASHE